MSGNVDWTNTKEVKAYKKEWYLKNKEITLERSRLRRQEKKSELNKYYTNKYRNDSDYRNKRLVRSITYRKLVKDNKIDKCSLCESKDNLEIHHNTYDVTNDYKILCMPCHKNLHNEMEC